MVNKDPSEEFDAEFLRDYRRKCDVTMRMAITQISMMCEWITSESEDSKSVGSATNAILQACCTLMQTVELNSSLLLWDEESRPETEVVDALRYLKNFANDCTEVTGAAGQIEVSGEEWLYIRVTRRLLNFMLLSAVRPLIQQKAEKITLTCRRESGEVVLEISPLPVTRKDDFGVLPELSQEHSDRLMKAFASRLGSVYERGGGSMTVSFPEDRSYGREQVRAPSPYNVKRNFSEFRVMLGDISGYQFY